MERTKLLTLSVISLLVVNLFTIGFLVLRSAQLPLRPPEAQEPATIIIERLHFDQDQQQAYRQLVTQHQQQTQALNRRMIGFHQQYYRLLASPRPDSAQATTLSGQIADKERQLAELNFSHFQQIKALCRADQQADFTHLVDDLARLFNRPQRPSRPGGGSREVSPENFPPRP